MKDRIRAAGYPLRDGYPDARSLGDSVRADLTALIERLFPARAAASARERAESDQGAFADRLIAVYVGRRRDFDRLDAHADGDGPPLVLGGGPGAGKSALLANWLDARSGRHRGEPKLVATPWERALGALGRSWRGRPQAAESLLAEWH